MERFQGLRGVKFRSRAGAAQFSATLLCNKRLPRKYVDSRTSKRLLLSLEETHEHIKGLGFFAELSHDGARAAHDLGGLASLVDLAEASVLAELLAGVHHEEVNAALLAERLHQLGVLRVVAVRRQAAQLGRLLVECLGAPTINEKAMRV